MSQAGFATISPQAIRQQLASGAEVAFIDIREAGEYGNGHALLAVNLPWSELEIRVGQLIPRRHTLIIVQDATDDGRATTAAQRLKQLGYQEIRVAEGGIQGWESAGFLLFQGVNVPSKAFSEWIEREAHTPTLSAETLSGWQQQSYPHVLLDGRTPKEFHQFHIPGAINCPNGELIPWVQDYAAAASLPVVITCAGRTRGIIGAQSLIDAGIKNPVLALAGGTQAWRIARLPLTFKDAQFWTPKNPPVETAVLQHPAIGQINSQTLPQDPSRTTYVFDVRSREEYLQGTVPGAVWVPAGQLIQTLDEYVGTRGARLVLFDPQQSRAQMAAWWLYQLGWDVSIWIDAGLLKPPVTVPPDLPGLFPQVSALTATAARRQYQPGDTLLIADRSKNLAEPVIAGSRWVNRAVLAQQVATLPKEHTVWVFAKQSSLAWAVAWDLNTRYGFHARVVEGDENDWRAAGWAFDDQKLALTEAERIDYLFWLHDRHSGNLDASAQYLAWEASLPDAVDHDGQHGFRRLLPVTQTEGVLP
ncbi:rhodanese-like domain-containing protein [Pantoea cypripedii]|uniref:Sulfurtransferase n=1 Tax=Pantoea cypripedii TaxID=55209 RepID=A0A6B9GGR0_PANCY|nr:rhodanese-like domain-containing protein [Pantoea cypripedii]QGY33119.1 sulfurtransferase [Pantoea cypripedii]